MIYLASQSARRKEILRSMKIRFRVIPSFYQERLIPGYAPRDLVVKHAEGKALHAKAPRTARYVLAADTLVWRKKFYGKPKSLREAHKILRALSGRVHEVYTGVVLWDRVRGRLMKGVSCTRVRFKKLTSAQIDNYLLAIQPLDKAGAYAIQEGPRIVARIQGSYSNVVGLPRELVRRLLRKIS